MATKEWTQRDTREWRKYWSLKDPMIAETKAVLQMLDTIEELQEQVARFHNEAADRQLVDVLRGRWREELGPATRFRFQMDAVKEEMS